MTQFATNMQKTARDLINLRGKTIQYTSVVTGAYDQSISKAPVTTTTNNIKAIVTDGSSTNLETGTLVNIGDKSILISGLALPTPPQTTDSVLVDGVSYSVYIANPVYAEELVVTYKLKARHQ